jgi:transposase InsO family protein
VGWALDMHVRETLILEALTMASGRRDLSPGLLLHSDRGVQYRGNEYQETLSHLGITASMSRKGNCWDNAVMEAFFARLKVELIYPENYRTIEELRAGLFEYIEIFYNRQRRHSALSYDNPSHFELLFQRMNVSTICG